MKQKILYVDMDMVLANLDKVILNLDPTIGTMSLDAPFLKERSKKIVKTIIDNPRIFKDLEPIEGSISAVKRLFKHYDVLFLSTPMWQVPESFMDKRLWIEQHFGHAATNRLILSQRKGLNIGDYLVDDRTWNGASEFLGTHLHFGTEAFPTWVETEDFLMENKSFIFDKSHKEEKKVLSL